MSKRRALTLVEALITAFLVFLVGSLAVSLLVQARAVALTSNDEAEAAVDLQAAGWLLTRELAESGFDGLTLSTQPQAIAMQTARDDHGNFVTDQTGAPVWQGYIVYWVDGGLHRQVFRETATQAFPVSRLASLSTRSASRLTPNVLQLEPLLKPDAHAVQLKLIWQGRTSLGKTETHQSQAEVDVWN